MGDSENILVTADSAGAVTQFNNLSGAVGGLDNTMESMGNTFAKPLEHVGVHLFGTELLQTVGIAGGARPIIMLLQTAVTELGMTFGFAGGEVGLVVMGLAAAAAVIYKVVEAHKAHAESLDKEISSEETTLKTTTDLRDEFVKYSESIHNTSPELLNLISATEAYTKDQEKLLSLDLTKKLDDLKESLSKVTEAHRVEIESSAISAATMDHYASGTKNATDANGAYSKAILKQSTDTAGLKLQITQLTDELNRYAKTGELISDKDYYSKPKDDVTAYSKELDKLNQNMSALAGLTKQYADQDAEYSGSTWDRKTAKIQAELDKETSAIKKYFDKGASDLKAAESTELAEVTKAHGDIAAVKEKYAKLSSDLQVSAINAVEAADKLAADKRTSLTTNYFNTTNAQWLDLANVATSSIDSAAAAFGKDLADMTKGGKIFHDDMTHFWSDMVQQFISAVLQMEMKWAAASLIMGGGSPIVAAMPHFAFASGGMGMVTKPTSILVGEGGEDEFVSIVPKSQMNSEIEPLSLGKISASPSPSSSSSSSTTNQSSATNNFNFYVSGQQDPATFGKHVMQYILQETRGRGQVTVKSASIW